MKQLVHWAWSIDLIWIGNDFEQTCKNAHEKNENIRRCAVAVHKMKKTSSSFKNKRFWAEIRFADLVTDLSYSWDSILGKDFYILMDSVTAVKMKKKQYLPDPLWHFIQWKSGRCVGGQMISG